MPTTCVLIAWHLFSLEKNKFFAFEFLLCFFVCEHFWLLACISAFLFMYF